MSKIQNIITTILIGGTTALGGAASGHFLVKQIKKNLTRAGQTIAWEINN